MKAWRYVGSGQPLTLTEIEEPTPGDGEVVIDVRAAGICHTVVGMLDGTLAHLLSDQPQTLGDEIAGVVSAVGAGADGFRIGDRVAHAAFGRDTAGIGRDGGFGQKVALPTSHLVHIPANVGFAEAAVATDAGGTSYSAVHDSGRVQAGERVGIIGFGGLGSIAAQIAVAAGAQVHIAEIRPEARALAEAHPDYTVVADVMEFAEFGLDVVLDFAGTGTTTSQAMEVLRRRGRIVLVGAAVTEANVPLIRVIAKRLELVGCSVDSTQPTATVLQLLSQGALRFDLTEIAFDEIDAGVGRLARGETQGRLVAARGFSAQGF